MKRKTFASAMLMMFVFTFATMAAFAYNTKFSFNLTSGLGKA